MLHVILPSFASLLTLLIFSILQLWQPYLQALVLQLFSRFVITEPSPVRTNPVALVPNFVQFCTGTRRAHLSYEITYAFLSVDFNAVDRSILLYFFETNYSHKNKKR